MSANNQIENNESSCLSTAGIGTKLMFFILGGGIGAAVALLFAPKPGRELRRDHRRYSRKGLQRNDRGG